MSSGSGPSSTVGKDSNATLNAKPTITRTPLIPEHWIDVPAQRLYILSLGLLVQAIKAFDWFHTFLFPQSSKGITFKWLLVDLVYCVTLKKLRIPRLNYATAAVLLQIVTLWLLDGVLFGSIQIGVRNYSLSTSARELYFSESTSGRLSNSRNILTVDDHLKGEHTVRMSPVSTAKLNPYGDAFCLPSPSSAILIPVLLNNTKPSRLQYSFTHAGTSKIDIIDVSAKELRAIEYERMEHLQSSKLMIDDEDYNEDDYDPEDEIEARPKYQMISQSDNGLEPTESLVFLKVNKPGLLTLVNVTDFYAPNQVKVYSKEIVLVPCPRAYFAEDSISRGGTMKCAGDSEELSLAVSGIPPLSVSWHREINGLNEYFTVEKIDGTPERTNEAQEVIIPLAMSLDIAGSHSYVLDSVIDGMGNVQTLTPKIKPQGEQAVLKAQQTDAIRSVAVLKRASMSFGDCAPGSPVSLLRGGSVPLTVVAGDADQRDGPWRVTVRYTPPTSAGEEKIVDQVHSSDPGSSLVRFNTRTPGLFQIVDVRGNFCLGDILSPDFCRVVEEPYPTAEVEWKTIHECSGDTGASAYLRLSGKPPFKVVYQQKRNGEATKEMTKTFFSSRGEIVFQPESSGNYSYELLYLSDANYARRKLHLPAFNTVVHPLASASFASQDLQGVGTKRTINSCSGEFVDVDLDLRGDGPWNVELQVASPSETRIITKTGIKKNRERIRIDIPQVSEDESSSLYIDLVSVEDSYGCRKDLAVPGVVVNVRRLKPTVRFYAKDGRNYMTVLEKNEARLPLRLTGEGPWSVEYRRLDQSGPSKRIMIHSANGDLVVRQEGMYELIGVSDAFCSGSVVKDQSKFRIDWISRPTINITPDTLTSLERRNNSYIRRPVCEGNDDHIDLDLRGRPPYQIKYSVSRFSDAGGVRVLDVPTISSVQATTRVQLFTSEAGRIYYEVKQVGDANYPIAQSKDRTMPFKERLLFEQEVIARPSASFKRPTRLAYCLHDKFSAQEDSNNGLVYLEGQAPFYLDLTIRSLTTSSIHHETVEIRESQWTVSLPNYVFTSIGAHSVTIDSVRDSSTCQQITRTTDKRVLWVDVAESATIVPFDRREHICVGENTQFQLEGIPPWTIDYNINRKVHEQVVKQSPFVYLQQQPGDFEITSIAHQNRMCSSSVQNIHFTVHSLPAAQVAHGKDILEDIHEGNQAHIVFTLTGEPPFTFTYQRSEVPVKKGTKLGKTLETHTVSGVMSNEYSIYSALEGTWTVTSISDKYCRYPPVQLEASSEK